MFQPKGLIHLHYRSLIEERPHQVTLIRLAEREAIQESEDGAARHGIQKPQATKHP